jgi:hypothetical protein
MRAAAALLLVCAAAGCRATPGVSSDDLAVDDLGAGGGDDLAGADFSVADMACAVGPEVCGNGCDDDRNGYTDDDDPACTTQMLVTLTLGTPQLWRLILEPQPHVAVLDGNPVGSGGMAMYERIFAPAAFIAYDGGSKHVDRVVLGGGATTTLLTSYTTRDACVFNGELIVVDPRPSAPGYLHRYMSDGTTAIGTPIMVAGIPSACSSDGNLLYVSEHPTTGASDIRVFSKSANGPVDTTTVIALPDALVGSGYDRLVDFVYVKKSGLFIGLFTVESGTEGDVMAPFGLDGGSGPWIDGGVWHGVGEFAP